MPPSPPPQANPQPEPATPADTLAALRAGHLQGARRLDLRGCGLTELPIEVLTLADTLEVLDLSGNALTQLPDGLAGLQRLRILFCSNNPFTVLPPVLGRCPALDTVGFKANQICEVPAQALAPTLRWLILTDNRIEQMPAAVMACTRLQKLMLAGNRLRHWPPGWQALQRLELLRLSANQFACWADALPAELLALPRLAWLALAGNPFTLPRERAVLAGQAAPPADALPADDRPADDRPADDGPAGAAPADAQPSPARLPDVPWAELRLQGLLGEGASGHIHAAEWSGRPATTRADGAGALPTRPAAQAVAVKLFKGEVTSDGLPASEMAASLAAGHHPQLVGVLGRLAGHPDGRQGLVLRRLADGWQALAGPPSMASCSRDVYADGLRLPAVQAVAVARAIHGALSHLHHQGLLHGDLYAHNTLVDGAGGCLLSDLGAACFLPEGRAEAARRAALLALDWRAYGVLVDELAQHCDAPEALAPWRAEAAAAVDQGMRGRATRPVAAAPGAGL